MDAEIEGWRFRYDMRHGRKILVAWRGDQEILLGDDAFILDIDDGCCGIRFPVSLVKYMLEARRKGQICDGV